MIKSSPALTDGTSPSEPTRAAAPSLPVSYRSTASYPSLSLSLRWTYETVTGRSLLHWTPSKRMGRQGASHEMMSPYRLGATATSKILQLSAVPLGFVGRCELWRRRKPVCEFCARPCFLAFYRLMSELLLSSCLASPHFSLGCRFFLLTSHELRLGPCHLFHLDRRRSCCSSLASPHSSPRPSLLQSRPSGLVPCLSAIPFHLHYFDGQAGKYTHSGSLNMRYTIESTNCSSVLTL